MELFVGSLCDESPRDSIHSFKASSILHAFFFFSQHYQLLGNSKEECESWI